MEGNYFYTSKTRKLFGIKGCLRIKVPQKKVWEILTRPGHLKDFHPFVKSHKKSKWQKIGDRDSLLYYSGRKMGREIVDWKEGESVRIKMTNGKGNDLRVRFQTLKIDETSSEFSVHISSDAYRNVPRPFWYVFARYLVFKSFRKYLYSVLKGMEYHALTGKKTKENQFGKHRKFSL